MMIVRERPASKATPPETIAPVAEGAGRRAARSARSVLAVVLAILPIAAVTELLLVRTFYRVGIYIPKVGPFPNVYMVLTRVGSFAFNLSSILALIAIGAFAAGAYRRDRRRVAVGLGTFLAAVLLAGLSGSRDVAPVVRLLFVLALTGVAWPFVRSDERMFDRLAVAGVGLAALLSAYSGLTADAGTLVPSVAGPGGAVAAQLVGEAVVVASAFLLFAAWATSERLRPGPLMLGALPAAGLAVAWWANGAIAGILVLWSAGLRLYLPVGLYVVALWGFAAAAFGCRARRPWRTAGMALLLVGGFFMDTTYLMSLVLIAVVLLTDGTALGGLPELAEGRDA